VSISPSRLLSRTPRPAPDGAALAASLARASARARLDPWLLGILAAAGVVRAVFFALFRGLPLLMDEVQYQEIAVNVAEGRGFALDEKLTSWRPPLYPFLMALLYRVAGAADPDVVRLFQAALSLGTVLVLYALAREVFGRRTARAAAAVAAFYPSLLFYNNHVLTEVVFIFLCAVVAWGLAVYLARPRALVAAGIGLVLGLAVLTREIIWPTVALLSLLMALAGRGSWRRWAAHSLLLVMGLLAVTAPWVVRNTHVQGTFTLIATNSGPVFLSGNYEHTPWDRPWQANALPPELKVRRLFDPALSEGQVQKLAMQRALAYIREHPWRTLRMNVIRVANLWGLERELVGVFGKGGYGVAGTLNLVASAAILNAAYVLVVLAGLAVLAFRLQDHWARRSTPADLAPPDAAPGGGAGRQALAWHLYVVGLVLYTTLAHAPASAHPRYHLPLIPFLGLYAVQAWSMRHQLWAGRRTAAGRAFAVCAGLLALAWARDILVDLERFLRFAKLL